MKKIFICALAAGMFTACSQEETLSTQAPMQISFDGAYVENASRADKADDPSTQTANLTAFDVWGFMDNSNGDLWKNDAGEDVNKTDAGWSYTNTAYWFAGHTYYFAALAPQNSPRIEKQFASGDDAKKGLGTITFTNGTEDKEPGTEDLLYSAVEYKDVANLKEITSQPAPVKFMFSHLLSKVKFTFTNGFAAETYKIEITKLTMDVAKKATINLADDDWWTENEWTNYTETSTLNFGTIPALFNTKVQESQYERLTFPTDANKEYEVKLEATLWIGDVNAKTIEKTIKISETALKMGHAYNFVAELNEKNFVSDDDDASELYPITFDAEVYEWVPEGGEKVEVSFEISNEAELQQALATGGSYYLSKDVELTSSLTVTEDVVLNLNGKTLKNKVDNTNTDVIVVAEGATLTINGEGTVEAVTGNDGYAVIADGTVIINGGTFKAGKDTEDKANAVVYARNNGKVYVNGGTFPNESESAYVLNKKDADRATTTIEVKGGTFTKFNPANNAAEGAGTNFLAEGYKSTETTEGSNVWTVTKAE